MTETMNSLFCQEALNTDAEERGILYAVYTMKDKSIDKIFYSWTRRRNYLCTDGEIYSEGSDGAA